MPDEQSTAALSREDSLTVRRAVTAGVAVPADRADLAPAAVQQAESGLAVMNRLLIGPMHRVYQVMAALSVLLLVLNLVLLATGSNNRTTWINIALWTALTVLYARAPSWHRRRVARLRSALEANRTLLRRD